MGFFTIFRNRGVKGTLHYIYRRLGGLSKRIDNITLAASGISADAGNDIINGSDSAAYFHEAHTTLSLSGTILSYLNETGGTTSIDLAPIISDTNLARVVSGSVVGNNIVFTRDDASTFNIDVATLVGGGGGFTSVITNVIAGNPIATHNDGDSVAVVVNESITGLSLSGNNLTYTKEGGTLDVIDLSAYLDGSNDPRIVSGTVDSAGSMTLTRGDASTITIDLSALLDNVDYKSTIGSTIVGNPIGIHNDGDGNTTTLNETITNLTIVTNNLVYTKEDGTTDTIDLSLYLDDTNAAYIVSGTMAINGVATFTRDDATTFTVDMSVLLDDTTTKSIIASTIAGNTIAIHSDGASLDVDINETITGLVLSGTDLVYSREGGTVQTLDMSGFMDNTNLSRIVSGTVNGVGLLTLTRDDATFFGIDLSSLVDSNTISIITNAAVTGNRIFTHNDGDGTIQDVFETITGLTLVGNNLFYTKEGGAVDNIDLSTFVNTNLARVVSGSLAGTTLTLTRDDASTFTISLAGIGGGSGSISVITNTVAGHKIADHDDGNGTVVAINETITDLAFASNILTYTKEDGTTDIIDLSAYVGDVSVVSAALSGSIVTFTKSDASTFTLDLSTLNTGGGDTSVFTNTLVSGNLIGTHDSGGGTVVNVRETITSIAKVSDTITFIDEAGASTNIDLSAYTNTNLARITSATLSGAVLTLTRSDATTVTVNLSAIDNNDTSVITNTVAGHLIATHDDGNGTSVDIDETITSLSLAANILTFTDEAGADTDLDLSLYLDDTNLARLTSGTVDAGGIATFTRDDATTFTIDFSTLLNTNFISTITNVVTGHKIADHSDGDGNIVTINETVTSLTLVGNNLSLAKEDGTSDTIDLTPYLDNTNLARVVSVALAGSVLTFTRDDASTFDVTLTGLTGTTSVITNTVTGHKIADHDDGDGNTVPINETVTGLTLVGNNLALAKEDGTTDTIDLSPYLDNTNLARVVSVALAGSVLTFTRDDASTFNVTLTGLSGNTSVITNTITGHLIANHDDGDGNTVAINETITGLTLVGNNLSLAKEDGTNDTVDLSPYLDNTNLARVVSLALSGNTLTLTRDDASTFDVDLSGLGGGGTTSVITGVVTGHKIFAHDDGNGTVLDVNETITQFTNPLAHNHLFTNEAGSPYLLNLSQYINTSSAVTDQNATGNQVALHIAGDSTSTGIRETVTSLTFASDTLSFAREGGNVQTIDLSGYITTVSGMAYLLPLTGTNVTTVQTMSHTDGNGTVTALYEHVANTTYHAGTSIMTFTNGFGGIIQHDLSYLENAVISAFGRTGAVVAAAGDYDAIQVDVDASGFSGALSAADITVQRSLETLDGAAFGGTPVLSASITFTTGTNTVTDNDGNGILGTWPVGTMFTGNGVNNRNYTVATIVGADSITVNESITTDTDSYTLVKIS